MNVQIIAAKACFFSFLAICTRARSRVLFTRTIKKCEKSHNFSRDRGAMSLISADRSSSEGSPDSIYAEFVYAKDLNYGIVKI